MSPSPAGLNVYAPYTTYAKSTLTLILTTNQNTPIYSSWYKAIQGYQES